MKVIGLRQFNLFVYSALLALLMSACGSDNPSLLFRETQDATDLTGTVAVVSSVPEAEATNVPVETEIRLNFSGRLRWNDVDFFRFRVEDEFGVPVEGQISISDDDQSLIFQPRRGRTNRNLRPATTYTVRSRFLRDRKRIPVTPYSFRFRTEEAPPSTGELELVEIQPETRWVIPSNEIRLTFNKTLELPTAGDLASPYCSRIQYADMFQIIVTHYDDSDGTINFDPVGGIACVNNSNRKQLIFEPDDDLPIFPGTTFISVVRITIRYSDGLISEGGDTLPEDFERTVHKLVTPDPYVIAQGVNQLFFGGQASFP